MSLDERRLSDLMEESGDLHSDAMKDTKGALSEMVETTQHQGPSPDQLEENRAFARRRRELLRGTLLGAGALAGAGVGSVLLGLFDQPAFADQSADVQMLQTAASIENLAVATYRTALTLPFIGGSSANPVVKAFAQMTMKQHDQHNDAFNSAVKSLGGKAQTSADPKYAAVVKAAVPGIKGPADVVGLALKLEQVAAQTYVADVSALSDVNARKTTASIMGVEAQHVSILLAVQALLAANAAQLIALPPNAGALPAAAGSLGFPNSFYPTTLASPAAEGALQ